MAKRNELLDIIRKFGEASTDAGYFTNDERMEKSAEEADKLYDKIVTILNTIQFPEDLKNYYAYTVNTSRSDGCTSVIGMFESEQQRDTEYKIIQTLFDGSIDNSNTGIVTAKDINEAIKKVNEGEWCLQ